MHDGGRQPCALLLLNESKISGSREQERERIVSLHTITVRSHTQAIHEKALGVLNHIHSWCSRVIGSGSSRLPSYSCRLYLPINPVAIRLHDFMIGCLDPWQCTSHNMWENGGRSHCTHMAAALHPVPHQHAMAVIPTQSTYESSLPYTFVEDIWSALLRNSHIISILFATPWVVCQLLYAGHSLKIYSPHCRPTVYSISGPLHSKCALIFLLRFCISCFQQNNGFRDMQWAKNLQIVCCFQMTLYAYGISSSTQPVYLYSAPNHSVCQ